MFSITCLVTVFACSFWDAICNAGLDAALEKKAYINKEYWCIVVLNYTWNTQCFPIHCFNSHEISKQLLIYNKYLIDAFD